MTGSPGLRKLLNPTQRGGVPILKASLEPAIELAGPVRRVGIMGGTFDPIHIGHLLMAEESRQGFALDRVFFVPNGLPAHKKSYLVTSPEHRFKMAVLATASNPFFICSRVEIERSGPSFAIDTIRHFRSVYPDLEALYFITGADAITQILTWRDYESLVRECLFIAVTRPGFLLEQVFEELPSEIVEQITFLSIPGLDVSSTEIRRRVREGRSIKYLIPEAVEDYILESGLYRRKPVTSGN